MVNQRKLGINWGASGISLVELNKDTPVEAAFLSFADLHNASSSKLPHISEDFRLLEELNKLFVSGSFSIGNAFLSLPSSDIIVRWFVIPWVNPDEIQSVVRFEAVKHVPFPLEELIYNYYPSTITVDSVRKIGVAFTAIRKANYERITNVLIQAGVNIVYSEPSAMSLLRALTLRGLVKTEQISAILTAQEDSGEIAIVSQGYVKFIRDFSIRAGQDVAAGMTEDIVKAKFYNEVRVSIDFFARQSAGSDVEKIVALSAGVHQSLFDSFSDEVNASVAMVDPYQVLTSFSAVPDIAYIRAMGVGLSGAVPSVIDFNLSEGQTHGTHKKIETARPAVFPVKLAAAVGISVVCAVACVLGFLWSDGQVKVKESSRQEVSGRLGIYADMPREEIDAKIQFLSKKIDVVKTAPFKSDISHVLVYFIQLMPQGMWLDKIELSNKDDARIVKDSGEPDAAQGKKLTADDLYTVKSLLEMQVSGFISLEDPNSEFEAVNQFFETVKTNAQVHKYFSNIKLKSLQTVKSSQSRSITGFTIEFK
jgi:Tfp pilus assembly PilM family ATPase